VQSVMRRKRQINNNKISAVVKKDNCAFVKQRQFFIEKIVKYEEKTSYNLLFVDTLRAFVISFLKWYREGI